MQHSPAKHAPTAWRDLQRDWQGWSSWERRAIGALAFASTASAIFWFAMSAKLMW